MKNEAGKITHLRKCVGCGNFFEKKELLRIVRGKSNEFSEENSCANPQGTKNSVKFVVDTAGKQNGRGAYLCKNTGCLELAKKRGGFARSFKMKIPPDIFDFAEKIFQNGGSAVLKKGKETENSGKDS